MKTLPNHYISDDTPTWKDTAFQLLGVWFLLSGLLIVSAYDNHIEAKEKIVDQQRAIEKLERELSLPGARILDNDGNYKCVSVNGIRNEWTLVVGQKCEELAKAMWAGRGK